MRRFVAGFTLIGSLVAAAWLGSCSSNPAAPKVVPPAAELSGSLAAGSQYSHTFVTAGTFNYMCTIHGSCGGLQGTIVVVSPATGIQSRVLAIAISGGSAGGPYGGASCSDLSNTSDSVHVGDQVTWTNNSTLPHNVTSH